MTPSYSPLWSMITGSSLWKEPPHVVKVFITMIAVKNREHCVLFGPQHLFNLTQLDDEKQFLDAIHVLESPDTKSKFKQEFDGRRIERLKDRPGWLILNGAKYQKMMTDANLAAKKSAKKAEERAAIKALANKVNHVDGNEVAAVKAVENGDEVAYLAAIDRANSGARVTPTEQLDLDDDPADLETVEFARGVSEGGES